MNAMRGSRNGKLPAEAVAELSKLKHCKADTPFDSRLVCRGALFQRWSRWTDRSERSVTAVPARIGAIQSKDRERSHAIRLTLSHTPLLIDITNWTLCRVMNCGGC